MEMKNGILEFTRLQTEIKTEAKQYKTSWLSPKANEANEYSHTFNVICHLNNSQSLVSKILSLMPPVLQLDESADRFMVRKRFLVADCLVYQVLCVLSDFPIMFQVTFPSKCVQIV